MASTKKMTITLIQLGRIGDIIQTINTISDAHDVEVVFNMVCRKSFGWPLREITAPYFKEIIYLDTDSYFINSESVSDCQHKLNTSINEINELKSQALINLTFSKSSAFLMEVLDCSIKIGQVQKSKKSFVIKDCWSQYVYSNVMAGPHSVFNLVDVFRKMIGLPYNYKDSIFIKKPKGSKKSIVVNPFASHAKKHWTVDKWANAIAHLLQNKEIEIFLVGSKAEEDKATQIINKLNLPKHSMERIYNLAGKTSLPDLSALLKECSLFVGHDSMTSHLAALNETQTLTVSIGTVRPVETMPYGPDHYTLSATKSCFPCFPVDPCEKYECHDDIDPRLVAILSEKLLTGLSIPEALDKDLEKFFTQCKLYKTKAGQFSLKTQKVFPLQLSADEIFNDFLYQCWQFVLSDQEDLLDFPELNQEVCDDLVKLVEGLEYFYEVNGFSQSFCKTIVEEASSKNPNMTKVTEQSAKLRETESLTRSIKKQYPALSPILNYYSLQLKLNDGKTLLELAENSLLIYHQQNLYIGVIYDFTLKTIENFQSRNRAHLKQLDPKNPL